ncbi:MAG: low molecular weight protein tyrosine phosphatase family protein [Proteobacteria bacterium]|nr:low molecular weight protein tyrosine phosphatase family protein [Pseudomonadota bacterium]HRF82994.1 low molecular weight protein tyrosine phosphatase family protein [Pseudoxanthomonas sp.]
MTHKVLFICGKNRLRSPTAEHVFADWPGIETSSAGINVDSDSPVTAELLQWADTIFCMERSHRAKLSARFKSHLAGTKIVCLDIPDDFEYMAPELVAVLRARVPRHLPSALPRG